MLRVSPPIFHKVIENTSLAIVNPQRFGSMEILIFGQFSDPSMLNPSFQQSKSLDLGPRSIGPTCTNLSLALASTQVGMPFLLWGTPKHMRSREIRGWK